MEIHTELDGENKQKIFLPLLNASISQILRKKHSETKMKCSLELHHIHKMLKHTNPGQ